MTKLAQTQGLTEVQTEILATVRQFVDKEIIPNAPEFEKTDTYPQPIVDLAQSRLRALEAFSGLPAA